MTCRCDVTVKGVKCQRAAAFQLSSTVRQGDRVFRACGTHLRALVDGALDHFGALTIIRANH